jgi:hypothetical protein
VLLPDNDKTEKAWMKEQREHLDGKKGEGFKERSADLGAL